MLLQDWVEENIGSSGLVGIFIIMVIAYLISTIIGYLYLGSTFEETSIRVGIGSALATLALATGILYQSFQNEMELRNTQEQTLVLQESEWLPEVRQPLHSNLLAFSENRPWYPWFMVSDNESSSKWHEGFVFRTTEDYDFDEAVDWVTPFPDGIGKYLEKSGGRGEEFAELIFRFESMTGEDYFFVYHIRFRSGKDWLEIFETPDVDRYLPWSESNRRDEFREDLSQSIEEGQAIRRDKPYTQGKPENSN